MGCDRCNYWKDECTASPKVRRYLCGYEPDERKRGSNYTPPKKKRRKK